MKKLKIIKGFYRTAGIKFKWCPEYDIRGVGIGRQFFEEPKLEIEVEGKKYEIDTKEAMDFINKYRSIIFTKGKKIGVVSKSLLKELST